MKKIIYLIVFVVFSLQSFSQSNCKIKYTYDNAGNRKIREKECRETTHRSVKADTLKNNIIVKDILIYPNPVKQNLNIVIEDYKDEQGLVYIYTSNGSLIKTKKINSTKTLVDFSKQAYGAYVVKVNIADKTKEYSIIKQK